MACAPTPGGSDPVFLQQLINGLMLGSSYALIRQ